MTKADLGPFYSGLEAADPSEPWSEASARARLETLRSQIPVRLPTRPELVPSNNNDVWKLDEGYLRVAWRGDLERLETEARLLGALKGVVPVPEVLDLGRSEALAWSLQSAVAGRPMDEFLDGPRGRDVFRQAVEALRRLHQWEVPIELRQRLGPGGGTIMERAGREVVILPRSAVLDLVDATRGAPYADGEVLDLIAARVAELPDVDPAGPSLLHGDFYVGNVLIQDGEVSGLIDFEFARTGPVDLELISVVRALDAEARAGVTRPPLLEWMREDYPAAFDGPDLTRRLWLYAISYSLRQALFWPADRPETEGLEMTHPLHTLRRLVVSSLPGS